MHTILSAAGSHRQCLPEIAPQGHFLALRAHGATSTFGLLAMTTQGRTGSQPALLRRHKQTLPPGGGRVFSLSKKSLRDFSPSCFQNCKIEFCCILFCNSAAAAGDWTRKDTLTVSFHTFLPSEAFGLAVFLTVCRAKARVPCFSFVLTGRGCVMHRKNAGQRQKRP